MYRLCARCSFLKYLRSRFIYHCINNLKPILWMKSVSLVFFASPFFKSQSLVYECNLLTFLCVAYSDSMPYAHDSETHRVGTSLKSNYFIRSSARLNAVFHFTQFKYELPLSPTIAHVECWISCESGVAKIITSSNEFSDLFHKIKLTPTARQLCEYYNKMQWR